MFLGGVGLLLLVFRLAYEMFSVSPSDVLHIKGAKAIDFGTVGNSVTEIIVKILLLLVMGVCGSLIANRGILLYTHSRGLDHKPAPKETP
ncbi:hypothetical protein OP10G_0762 [Fimbriimonas ginsengisoli Gsoil 348]|uniref:Uncharacterized protein n=1 Tax=Fimbriimonas ginsengisoli Gsoil 348 TaxID=661478 RepID=A0A068NN25_FIMGI|nr:hypothetical protein OP10G_0762 [Fimbriimonas ginsengisoli Gsoil 348]